MFFILVMENGGNKFPFFGVDFRKKRIGFKSGMNPGQFNFIGFFHAHFKYFPATNYKGLLVIFCCNFQCFFKGMDNYRPRCFVIFLPCNNYMGPVGQEFRKRFESPPPHDDVVPGGEFFKSLKIIGQMPNEIVVFSQGIVLPGCGYEGNFGHNQVL